MHSTAYIATHTDTHTHTHTSTYHHHTNAYHDDGTNSSAHIDATSGLCGIVGCMRNYHMQNDIQHQCVEGRRWRGVQSQPWRGALVQLVCPTL